MFTFEESKAILSHPAVDAAMRDVVGGRKIKLTNPLPRWRFADKDISCGPFRLLAECAKAAVNIGVLTATGLDRERLLILLRLAEGDPSSYVAQSLADTVEQYAVEMQHGADGWRSYSEHIKRYTQSAPSV